MRIQGLPVKDVGNKFKEERFHTNGHNHPMKRIAPGCGNDC